MGSAFSGSLTLAGSLVSAFASRLPDFWQDIGLYLGIALACFGAAGLCWKTITRWRATNKNTPNNKLASGQSHKPDDVPSILAAERRKLIAKAREFVARTLAAHPGDSGHFKRQLELDITFLNLEPHLSKDYLAMLRAQRTFYVPRDGTLRPALADRFLEELKRLETEWGLLAGSPDEHSDMRG